MEFCCDLHTNTNPCHRNCTQLYYKRKYLYILCFYNTAGEKVKVFVYSPDIPVGSADFTVCTPRHWNSLLHSLISQGGNAEQFPAAAAIHILPFLVPPGTHYCWCRLCGFKASPRLFTHDQRCGNRTPDLNIRSNALSTRPHAPYWYWKYFVVHNIPHTLYE